MDYVLPPITILLVLPASESGDGIGAGLRADPHATGAPTLIQVHDLDAAIEVLRRRPVDVILMHLDLPGVTGLEAVERLLSEVDDAPVVIVAHHGQEDMAREALSAGVQDYLLTSEADPRSMHRVIRNAVERHRLLQMQRASRAAAEQARRMRDDVISVVSHDLRAPLNAISLCARGLNDPHADHAALGRTIAQAAEWSRRVIRDLLDVAAIDRGQLRIVPHACDVCDVADDAHALFQQEADARHLRLVVRCPHGRLSAFVDPDRLQQAIDNLLDNAIRATPAGGVVTLAVLADGAEGVAITVSDTGCGIAAEVLPTLFLTGPRRAEGHRSHLGLRIAKAIAEAHGGTLTAESTVGAGSVFALHLPRGGSPSDAVTAGTPAPAA